MTAFTRLALTGLTAGLLACSGASVAQAADGHEPPALSAADQAAAAKAASSATGLDLARRVVETKADAEGPSSVRRSAGRPSIVSGTTTQVNVLNPDFVAHGRGPVGKLGYVSTTARVGDELVSVWAARAKDGSGWKAVNAAAGDLESQVARRARGGQVVHEPQIDAWYAVKGARMLPLNEEARRAVGAGISVTDYQTRVHDLYADKMPGSAYDTSGMAGGFEAPASAPAPQSDPGAGSTAALAGFGVLGAAGAAGAVVAGRRRRSEV